MSGDLTRYQDLILVDGSTFFISELNGDVRPETSEGYFHDDVRHLSHWCLRVDGEQLQGITARAIDYNAGRVHAVTGPGRPATRCAATGSSPTASTRTSWSPAMCRRSRS
jgi:N-terminal domain of (some) glycogen debranching enzymes